MNNENQAKIKHLDTYGVGNNCFISAVKVGKTTFIVSSYFEKGKPFCDSMDNIIKNQIIAS